MNRLPHSTNHFVVLHKHHLITKCFLAKQPISSFLDTAINLISLGKWESEKKNLSYDDLFHTFLIGHLEIPGKRNEIITIQKNASIKVTNISEKQLGAKYFVEMEFPKLTLKELLLKTKEKMGDDNFYRYDGASNSCQHFIYNLIDAVRPITATEKSFICQDTELLFAKMPSYVSNVVNGVTDIASFWNILANDDL